jgi:transketolase
LTKLRVSHYLVSMHPSELAHIALQIRRYCLSVSTKAGSGHPTSSLSATDLMTVLFFGGYFEYNLDQPNFPDNDRLIFSKGHASPLFYALWAVKGGIDATELDTYRQFGGRLEGHPTLAFPFTEATTGSLGQGLSIGLGLSINSKMQTNQWPTVGQNTEFLKQTTNSREYNTFVLLGDSELAEGSNWEAMQLASYYKLDNLIGIIDVNRLGQRGETMVGWDVQNYQRKTEAFGWDALVIDGHDLQAIGQAFEDLLKNKNGRPKMLIAKTVKGKGVSFLEDQNGWHGKALNLEDLNRALKELSSNN